MFLDILESSIIGIDSIWHRPGKLPRRLGEAVAEETRREPKGGPF
jgi:hypothetical protein